MALDHSENKLKRYKEQLKKERNDNPYKNQI